MTRYNITPSVQQSRRTLGVSSFKAILLNLVKYTDAKSGGTENNLAQSLSSDRPIALYLWIEIE
jgi:hypothetical protein